MDSGNSGTFQSLSVGDKEYDSRTTVARDSVNAFTRGGGPIYNPPPPFFDPLTDYLQLHQNSNPSVSLRNYSTLMSSSSAASHAALSTQNKDPNPAAACNQKKRSRASRRAPTTVFTTDTANFRAMVQEFTGIPAPQLHGSPSFPPTRLDHFGPSRSAASFDHPPPATYLRRPFSVKINPTQLPFLTLADAGASSSPTAINNYQIPSTQRSQNFSQNPFLANLLETNPKLPFSNHPPTQFSLGGGLGHSPMPCDQISQHNNSKMNTNFLNSSGGNRPENSNATGEGMVESWIYSSD